MTIQRMDIDVNSACTPCPVCNEYIVLCILILYFLYDFVKVVKLAITYKGDGFHVGKKLVNPQPGPKSWYICNNYSLDNFLFHMFFP